MKNNSSENQSRESVQRSELRSICKGAIEREIAQGRIERPGSMRPLWRRLMHEVVKSETWQLCSGVPEGG